MTYTRLEISNVEIWLDIHTPNPPSASARRQCVQLVLDRTLVVLVIRTDNMIRNETSEHRDPTKVEYYESVKDAQAVRILLDDRGYNKRHASEQRGGEEVADCVGFSWSSTLFESGLPVEIWRTKEMRGGKA